MVSYRSDVIVAGGGIAGLCTALGAQIVGLGRLPCLGLLGVTSLAEPVRDMSP
jgi:succinate dehydrogenase/fumarate reductase flavoprotein subunit